jgi:hypothetical protein
VYNHNTQSGGEEWQVLGEPFLSFFLPEFLHYANDDFPKSLPQKEFSDGKIYSEVLAWRGRADYLPLPAKGG